MSDKKSGSLNSKTPKPFLSLRNEGLDPGCVNMVSFVSVSEGKRVGAWGNSRGAFGVCSWLLKPHWPASIHRHVPKTKRPGDL